MIDGAPLSFSPIHIYLASIEREREIKKPPEFPAARC